MRSTFDFLRLHARQAVLTQRLLAASISSGSFLLVLLFPIPLKAGSDNSFENGEGLERCDLMSIEIEACAGPRKLHVISLAES